MPENGVTSLERPKFLTALRGLAPNTPHEALEFASDLSPAFGFLIFSESPGKVLLPLAVELIFLEAFVDLRLVSHGIWKLREGARNLLGHSDPDKQSLSAGQIPWVLFFGSMGLTASLALIGIILAFNKVPFLIAEGYMGTALARDPNLTLFAFIRSLPGTEQAAALFLSLLAARRYITRTWGFFQTRAFQSPGWSWIVLGLPELPNRERMSKPFLDLIEWWDHTDDRKDSDLQKWRAWIPSSIRTLAAIPVSLALFPGSLFIPLLFFSSSIGPAWMILAKAFMELWFERAYGPLDGGRRNS